MTYFRMGNPHYHRRAAVSRSCSGWEGVVPAGYGRQTLISCQLSALSYEQVQQQTVGRSRASSLIARANTMGSISNAGVSPRCC